jgi:chromosome partitioning protein
MDREACGMILVVGGTKGGSGKSLLACQLAVLRVHAGQTVALIDADEQASALEFTRQRAHRLGEAGYTLRPAREGDVTGQVRELTATHQDILIDVGGRDTASQRAALVVADVMLIPFVPTSVDLWTMDTVEGLLQEARRFHRALRASAVLNRVPPRSVETAEAAAVLQESSAWTYLATPIATRKAFSQAFGRGVAVTETRPADPKAIAELTTLADQLFSEGA